MSPLPRIRIIAVGGTISSTADSPAAAGVVPKLTAGDLVASIPGIEQVAQLETSDFKPITSNAMTVAGIVEVARAVDAAFSDDCHGVVITHGTGTLEETAYGLALMLPRGRPVVVVGAVRNPTLPGADGPGNLAAAIATAASPAATSLGPVVVMGDEIHAARWVHKGHSTRPASFVSLGAGPLGEVVEGEPHVWFQPRWEDYLGMPSGEPLPEVELIVAAAGMDGKGIHAAVANARAAVVIEAIGPGLVPPTILEAIDEAVAAGVPVVVASRCSAGRNFTGTYDVPGGEADLTRRGAVFSGYVSGVKARIRLMVGLQLGLTAREIFASQQS
jgi:L-asparaginase